MAKNVVALYGVHFANYLVPLILIPYLTRTLGVMAWGNLAFAQAFGQSIAILVEYGFSFSATRDVAQHRNSPDVLGRMLCEVTGAKVVLALLGVAAGAALWVFAPPMPDRLKLMVVSLIWAVAQGFSMLWYFQGLERLRFVPSLEFGTKASATIAVFFFVHRPEHAWRVLAFQAVAAVVSTIIATVIALREVPLLLPRFRAIYSVLESGFGIFLSRSAVGLYTSANAYILGLLAPAAEVGFFIGAERISRALYGLLNPVLQVIYPRMSSLVRESTAAADRFATRGLKVLASSGLIFGAILLLGAPVLVSTILGPGYARSVAVLRVLAVLPPTVAISNAFCMQWMLPLHMDKQFNLTVLGASFLNLLLAFLLAPRFGSIGMAVAVASAETAVTVGFYLSLVLNSVSIFSRTTVGARETLPVDGD